MTYAKSLSTILVVLLLCVVLMLPATFMAADARYRVKQLELELAARTLVTTGQPAAAPSPPLSPPSRTTAGTPEDMTRFAGPPGQPVAIFYGDIIVRGRITADDLVTSLGSMVTAQTRDASYAVDRCDDIPCVHGIQRALTDCVCVCDTHWSGPSCTVHDCYGHGLWIPSLAAMHGYCACQGNYTADTMCQFVQCRGMLAETCASLDVFGCISPDAIGANCSDECLAPNPCTARANWGVPHYPTSDHPFGLCGAGFQGIDGDGMLVRIGGMLCGDLNITACNEQFAAEAPNCCAMSVVSGSSDVQMADCSTLEEPRPLECAGYNDLSSCTGNGCAWCSDRICMSPLVANVTIDCVTPPQPPFQVQGQWMYTARPCTLATCPPAVVARVIEIWNTTNTTNEWRFEQIAGLPWPELGPLPVGLSGAVKIQLSGIGWLGVRSMQLMVVSDPEPWMVAYPSNDWQPSPWLLEGTPLQLIAAMSGSTELVCIASSRIDPLIQLQIFGRTQEPLLAVLPISAGACGTFRLDTSVLFDEMGEYALSADMEWITDGSAAAGMRVFDF